MLKEEVHTLLVQGFVTVSLHVPLELHCLLGVPLIASYPGIQVTMSAKFPPIVVGQRALPTPSSGDSQMPTTQLVSPQIS